MELRDPKTLGVAVRIQRWLDGLDQGHLVPIGNLKWAVGQARVIAYQADLKSARARLTVAKKEVPAKNVGDSQVTDYIRALDNAKALTKDAQKLSEKYQCLPEGTTRSGNAYKKGIAARAAAKAAQEALQERWEAEVDPKHHHLFHEAPAGGWTDRGPILSEFEWPPRLPKMELELRPDPELLDLPRHQQRELLRAELDKLLVPAPVSPVEPLQGRLAQSRKLTAR